MKHFFLAAAFFLDAVGVSVKDFENGEGLQVLREFLCHMQRWSECHHGVETDIILAAKGASIGESRGCDKFAKFIAAFKFVSQARQELVHWCFLHETDKRFERAEIERIDGIRSARTG